MIAVDTNVLVDLFLPTPHSDVARSLARAETEWHAPLLWRSEFASVLWQQHRAHGLDLDVARALHRQACRWMEGTEHVPSFEAVLPLAFEHDVTPYDAQFVAVARRIGAPLVSHDRALARAFADEVVSPSSLAGRS